MQGADHQALTAVRRLDLNASCFNEKEQSLLRLVEKVTRHAYKVTAADIERLRQVGWQEPQIAEAVYITALFAFFNRVADAFGLVDPRGFWQSLDSPTNPSNEPID